MLSAYLGLVLLGVFILRLRMFVDAVVRGPRGARGVSLTFDDGPHPIWTRRVLDILDEHRAKATFFVIGRKAEQHPEIIQDILDRGHAVGVHSYAHDRLFALRSGAMVRNDVCLAIDVIERLTGARPRLFRPPMGHTNPAIARVLDSLDLVTVGWTVRGGDACARATPRGVISRVRRGLRDGVVIALHDARERDVGEPVILRALPAILDAIEAAHLEVTTLREWL
jgi:peptidoglycan/xylan/chitin deacetylase (PgdA/CDA1 family)